MGPDLDTLATTLYVTVDDLLIQYPQWAPQRPAVGIAPKLSDAELVTLAVIGVLLRFDSEARFLRYAHAHLGPWFPYLPTRSAYNKRLRGSGRLLQHVIGWLARDSPSWWDDLWLVDSTPVECRRSRQTQQRSDLGGWAEYGYCDVAFPLLLGTASPSCGHTVGAADHLRSRRCQSRRTRHLLCHVGPRRDSPPRPDHHGRQRLSQRRLRGRPRSCRDQPHPPRHQNRSTAGGQTIPQSATPDHRIDIRHPQRPTRGDRSKWTGIYGFTG